MDKILLEQIAAINAQAAAAKEDWEVKMLVDRSLKLTEQLSWVKETEQRFVAQA